MHHVQLCIQDFCLHSFKYLPESMAAVNVCLISCVFNMLTPLTVYWFACLLKAECSWLRTCVSIYPCCEPICVHWSKSAPLGEALVTEWQTLSVVQHHKEGLHIPKRLAFCTKPNVLIIRKDYQCWNDKTTIRMLDYVVLNCQKLLLSPCSTRFSKKQMNTYRLIKMFDFYYTATETTRPSTL